MDEKMNKYEKMPLDKLFDYVDSFEGALISELTDEEIRNYLQAKAVAVEKGKVVKKQFLQLFGLSEEEVSK